MPESGGLMEEGSMQETFNSLVRLSAAMTIFGVQQVQTVVASASPKESVDKLREVIDGVAAVFAAKIDETKLPTLDSISHMGHDVVDPLFAITNMHNTTS